MYTHYIHLLNARIISKFQFTFYSLYRVVIFGTKNGV